MVYIVCEIVNEMDSLLVLSMRLSFSAIHVFLFHDPCTRCFVPLYTDIKLLLFFYYYFFFFINIKLLTVVNVKDARVQFECKPWIVLYVGTFFFSSFFIVVCILEPQKKPNFFFFLLFNIFIQVNNSNSSVLPLFFCVFF